MENRGNKRYTARPLSRLRLPGKSSVDIPRRVEGSPPPPLRTQILLNGSRLGFYEPIRVSINSALGKSPNESIVYTSVFAGAMSGVIGGMLRLYPSTDMYS